LTAQQPTSCTFKKTTGCNCKCPCEGHKTSSFPLPLFHHPFYHSSHSFLPTNSAQVGFVFLFALQLPAMANTNPTKTPPSYKQLKEDFVSNLSGGSVSEIAQVCTVATV
jgi:hypothetical protein